ncbi:MAG: aminoacetone oxidase family FAD-binding enzyme [Phycisphaerae bacterium]|nr:aminoacetone oxidase family FAD-binding enzyme [Phycisphaerae bacterium]
MRFLRRLPGVKDIQQHRGAEIIVVGAGAAGQMAAVAAGGAGRRVLLLEQMTQPGLKILASGGGRCNLTNLASPEEVAEAFGREGRFVLPALQTLHPGGLRGLMNSLGISTVADEQGRVFPADQKAMTLQAALRRKLKELGVELQCSRPVERLWIENGRLRGVELRDSQRLTGRCVILTCGGRSYAKLGGTGGGYDLAQQAGHTITPLSPALVPLVTRRRWCAKLAGVSLAGARVWLEARGQSKVGRTGDVLFTHRGVSGPAVLDISGDVAELLARGAEAPLKLQCIAGMDAKDWMGRFDEWRKAQGRRGIAKLLQQHLPARLCEVFREQANLPPQTPAAELPREAARRLTDLLGGAELTVTATEGFEAAFVTRGGVRLRDVNPETLQSRLQPGLFLAGELLNLDGPTGGYNLRWAFASGLHAGQSAANFARSSLK